MVSSTDERSSDSLYWLAIRGDVQSFKYCCEHSIVKFDQHALLSMVLKQMEEMLRYYYSVFPTEVANCTYIYEYLYESNRYELMYWLSNFLQIGIPYSSDYFFIGFGKLLKKKTLKKPEQFIEFLQIHKQQIMDDLYINEYIAVNVPEERRGDFYRLIDLITENK